MKNIIYRKIDGKTHILNTSTGSLISFDISEEERLDLFRNWKKLDLDEDSKNLFILKGQANSRLCRNNLIELGMEFGFPTTVNIEINRRCSLRCIHCYIGEKDLGSKDLSIFENKSLDELSTFLDDLLEMGVFLLVFTGGEPFLNKKLEKLIEMTSKKGFIVELFSNLQYIPPWFKDLEPNSSKIGRIQTSIYSSDEKVHDEITKTKGSFKKTIENLKYLLSKNFYVEVATPLMSKNYNTWRETKDFFLKLGVKQDFSWPIVDLYYSRKVGKNLLNISADQFKEFVDNNPDFIIKTDFSRGDDPICEAGKSLFSISSNGEIFPCSQLPHSVGNIKNDSIKSIYLSTGMKKFRNLKNSDTGINEAYNYCMGTNYSETEDPLIQPKFFLDSINKALENKPTN